MNINLITNDYPLKYCYSQEANKAIVVPIIAYNNYNVRLDRNVIDSDMPLNLTDHWPTIVSFNDKNGQYRNIETCPLDMHMILWGVSDDITVRAFKTDAASSYFSPELNDIVYHYIDYKQNGFTPTNLPPYTETILQEGEYIFVPNNHLVSIKTSKESDKDTSVLKLCFFDASNVNEFRNALKTESLISKTASKLLKQLNSPTDFDFSMNRDPPHETTIDKYLQYPRENEKKIELESNPNRRNRNGKSDHRDWQENSKWNFLITSLTIPQPPIPTILSIERTNVTFEWVTPYLPSPQDQTKFGVNVTLCLASAVNEASTQGLLPSSSSINDGNVNGCFVTTIERKNLRETVDIPASVIADTSIIIFQADILNLLPFTSYLARITIIYGDAGSAPSQWTSVFVTRPLVPPSIPIGPLIATPSSTYPTHILLTFNQPYDNGGSPILGYHVHLRSTEEFHETEWSWNGIYDAKLSTNLTIEVINLIPNTVYEFTVTAINEIGNSTESIISNEVRTKSQGTSSIIVGYNHEDRFQSITYRNFITKCSQDPKCSSFLNKQPIPTKISSHPIVTIDDNSQTLSFNDIETGKEVLFQVWDSHWSPRLFLVKGQLVWSVPPLADDHILYAQSQLNTSESLNLSPLTGKIAIVQRGHVPIVTKVLNVQKNGAIACVILDDGHCQEFDQKCIPGSDKAHGDRFASSDLPHIWSNVKIPVLLLKESDSLELLQLYHLNSFHEIHELYQNELAKSAQTSAEDL